MIQRQIEWMQMVWKSVWVGARMGMLGQFIVNGKEIVIGSIHKIEGFQTEVKEYIGDRNAVLAGDQDGKYCDHIGLQQIVSKRVRKSGRLLVVNLGESEAITCVQI